MRASLRRLAAVLIKALMARLRVALPQARDWLGAHPEVATPLKGAVADALALAQVWQVERYGTTRAQRRAR